MSEFRTSEEAESILSQWTEEGTNHRPYTLELNKADQHLVFFGTLHSNNPENLQFAQLENYWERFLVSGNPQKQAFSEGGQDTVAGLSKAEAIYHHGDPGLITWLAESRAIPVESPEPPLLTEVEHLIACGLTAEELVIHKMRQAMVQYTVFRRDDYPWSLYIYQSIKPFHEMDRFTGVDLSINGLLELYEQKTAKDIGHESVEELLEITHPKNSPVAAASIQLRDKYLFSAIEKKWLAGFDIFTVYGASHAVALEPALKNLVGSNSTHGQNWSEP